MYLAFSLTTSVSIVTIAFGLGIGNGSICGGHDECLTFSVGNGLLHIADAKVTLDLVPQRPEPGHSTVHPSQQIVVIVLAATDACFADQLFNL